MAMLEGVEGLTLKRLNDATVAWLERDYHKMTHYPIFTRAARPLVPAAPMLRFP